MEEPVIYYDRYDAPSDDGVRELERILNKLVPAEIEVIAMGGR